VLREVMQFLLDWWHPSC